MNLTHVPLLAGSLRYMLGLPIQNLGIIGMVLFPLEVIVDTLFHSSTAISLLAKKKK